MILHIMNPANNAANTVIPVFLYFLFIHIIKDVNIHIMPPFPNAVTLGIRKSRKGHLKFCIKSNI